jgi:VanZ family protein
MTLGCNDWRKLARLAWLVAVCGVLVLSLLPGKHLPPQVLDIWDKAQHAFGFVVLTVLGVLSYPSRAARTAAGLLVLGVLIEVAQSMTGWRYGEVADWVADVVGVAIGLPLGLYTNAVLTRWCRAALQR